MRAAAGSEAASLFRQLQREQVRLAMIRTRVENDEHPELVAQRGLCWSLRERLLQLPGVRGMPPYDAVPPSVPPVPPSVPSAPR